MHLNDILIPLAALLGLVLVVFLVGLVLPKKAGATCSVRYRKSPDLIWALISDHGKEPTWRPTVLRMQRVAEPGNRSVWMEVPKKGRGTLKFVTLESVAPSRLVREVSDERGAYTSVWTMTLAPASDGCVLTLSTETMLNSVILRLKRLFQPKAPLARRYLADLTARLGETSQPKCT